MNWALKEILSGLREGSRTKGDLTELLEAEPCESRSREAKPLLALEAMPLLYNKVQPLYADEASPRTDVEAEPLTSTALENRRPRCADGRRTKFQTESKKDTAREWEGEHGTPEPSGAKREIEKGKWRDRAHSRGPISKSCSA